MSYSVKQLAKLANVSVRTLHFYDEVGLLAPAGKKKNGYRYYEEKELLKLQQILFYRELEFSLDEIKKILGSPGFDMHKAFKDHKRLIKLKIERFNRLIATIDKTIIKLNKKNNMKDEELYGNFSKEEMERYSEEARQKWGDSDAFKQSTERVKKMGKEGLKKVLADAGKLSQEIAKCMEDGEDATGKRAQVLIARHFEGLRAFYEPTEQIYRGLAEMYVGDERFKKNYENVAKGLAQYMHDGMIYFISRQK